MPRIRWTPEEDERLLDLIAAGKSWTLISGPGPRKRPFGEINRDWTVVGREAQRFALAHEEDRVEGITQVTFRFGQRVEPLMQIECRAADDLPNLRRCGLLLTGSAQVVGALAQC